MEGEATRPAARDRDPEVHVQGTSPTRCPYCHDTLAGEAPLAACRACGARHHADCWGEDQRCASCGDAQGLFEGSRPREAESPAPGWAAVYAAGALASLALGIVTTLSPVLVVPAQLRAHVVQDEWTALLLGATALALAWFALSAWCGRAAWRAARGATARPSGRAPEPPSPEPR